MNQIGPSFTEKLSPKHQTTRSLTVIDMYILSAIIPITNLSPKATTIYLGNSAPKHQPQGKLQAPTNPKNQSEGNSGIKRILLPLDIAWHTASINRLIFSIKINTTTIIY